jgi:ABC-type transporter Mla subunit MlaD
MNELIDQITAVKNKAAEALDKTSPHVGNALSALDAAAFNLRNEAHRLEQVAARLEQKKAEAKAK